MAVSVTAWPKPTPAPAGPRGVSSSKSMPQRSMRWARAAATPASPAMRCTLAQEADTPGSEEIAFGVGFGDEEAGTVIGIQVPGVLGHRRDEQHRAAVAEQAVGEERGVATATLP